MHQRTASSPVLRVRPCVAQVDALVRAVQDAEHEILASSFWMGLRQCFAAAQEQLASQLASLHDADSGSSGARQADLQEVSGHAVGSLGNDEMRSTDEGAEPAATKACTRSDGNNDSNGPARSLLQADSLPTQQPQDSLLSRPAPEPSPAEDGCDEGRGLADACESPAKQAAPEGTLSSSTAPGSPAVLAQWVDVRQLVVYGLGSLEAGAFWRSAEPSAARM